MPTAFKQDSVLQNVRADIDVKALDKNALLKSETKEYDLPEKRYKSLIQKTPGVCGRRACISNTRLTVWNLVVWHQLGLSDQEILENYPQLTQRDLETAWNYYAHNKAEIDRDIKENEEVDNLSDEEFDKLLTVSCDND